MEFYSSEAFFEKGSNFRIMTTSFLDCPMHYHDFVEFAYILSGSAFHVIDGKKYKICKGDLFIMNTNTPHEIVRCEDNSENFVVLNFIFKPEFLDSRLSEGDDFVSRSHAFFFDLTNDLSGSAFIQLLGEETHQFKSLLDDMYRECSAKADGYEAIIRAYLTAMIVKIFRIYREENTANSSIRTIRNEMVGNAVEYIRQNYARNISLEELANRAYLSPTYFSRVFKECTGRTIPQYIRDLRVGEACRLLTESQMPVAEIAGKVGYNDMSSFYDAFRKVTRLSPGQYRRRQTD